MTINVKVKKKPGQGSGTKVTILIQQRMEYQVNGNKNTEEQNLMKKSQLKKKILKSKTLFIKLNSSSLYSKQRTIMQGELKSKWDLNIFLKQNMDKNIEHHNDMFNK